MQLSNTQKQILAILFASGEPIEAARVAEALELDRTTTERLILSIGDYLTETESPLELARLEESYQLCTRSAYAGVIKAALETKRNTPLSGAALEVLAIIAYNQPVTRAFVEQVRGVDSSGVVTSLTEKGLIEEVGRMDLPGRPISYGTTDNFLRTFGLQSISQLPPIEDTLPAQDAAVEGQIQFDMEDGDDNQTSMDILQ